VTGRLAYQIRWSGTGKGKTKVNVKTWPRRRDDHHLTRVNGLAASRRFREASDPPQTVGDCPDWEDNRILDLAAAVGASQTASLKSATPPPPIPIA
jgi:hypothetical protein